MIMSFLTTMIRIVATRVVLPALAIVSSSALLLASDHADPVDLWNRKRLEPGITDLFLFPMKANEEPAFPFKRTNGISLANPDLKPRESLSREEMSQISHVGVILCVRRALTETNKLMLEPYTYRIHMDLNNSIEYENQEEEKKINDVGSYHPISGNDREPMSINEARNRYGGMVGNANGISATVTITLELKNDATLRKLLIEGLSVNGMVKTLRIDGPNGSEDVVIGKRDPKKVSIWTGVRDDPFIFPAFFKTNIVAMVLSVPISCFPPEKHDWLIWATSHEGSKQVDHVGRSLRTQNPRFDILNTLHPRDHVTTIKQADDNPSLIRDVGVRINLQGVAAYRKRWDFVPDVMIYKRNIPVGFPNGRLLYDDVAALLAQHGDTLLLELSHQHPNGGWPRRTTNDKPFNETTEDKPQLAKFPYLAEPWPDRDPPPPPALTSENQGKLSTLVVILVLGIGLVFVLLDRIYLRWRRPLRYPYL
jgi:hypothetical protein